MGDIFRKKCNRKAIMALKTSSQVSKPRPRRSPRRAQMTTATEQLALYRWLRDQTLSRSRDERRQTLALRSELVRQWPPCSTSDRAAIEALIQVTLDMHRLDQEEIDTLRQAACGMRSAVQAIPQLGDRRSLLLRERADLVGLLTHGAMGA